MLIRLAINTYMVQINKSFLIHTLETKQLKIASKLTRFMNVSNTHVRRQMITKIIIRHICSYQSMGG